MKLEFGPWLPDIPALGNPGVTEMVAAGNARGATGTYNYVIFDDSLIDILKRYGIPLAVGVGGAVTVNGKDMPPEVAAQLGPQT